MQNYDIYKFFKGEKENPFDNVEQNAQSMYWFYESKFEEYFDEFETSDWLDFFDNYGLRKDFMDALAINDYRKPSDDSKGKVFNVWLKYLFSNKLYGEYGSENEYKKKYFALSVATNRTIKKKYRELQDRFDMGYEEGRATIVTQFICHRCKNNDKGYCTAYKKDLSHPQITTVQNKNECSFFNLK